MTSLPLSEALTKNLLKNVRLVATDMDGTLTQNGKFTTGLLKALEDLAAAGMSVLIVTGRSAGWVSGLASYLPVVGAIAENGGLFYFNNDAPVFLTPVPDILTHRHQLAITFEHLKAKFPQIQESSDNQFRITDWTFEVEKLTPPDLQQLSTLCYDRGWGFTYSAVQCHIKPLFQDKASGTIALLRDRFPMYAPAQVLTVGDSPNDESLFNPAYFPLSVGVANVMEYAERLIYKPAYVTTASEGEGFCELARSLLQTIL